MRSQCQLSVNEIGVALVLRAAALRPDWERDFIDGLFQGFVFGAPIPAEVTEVAVRVGVAKASLV